MVDEVGQEIGGGGELIRQLLASDQCQVRTAARVAAAAVAAAAAAAATSGGDSEQRMPDRHDRHHLDQSVVRISASERDQQFAVFAAIYRFATQADQASQLAQCSGGGDVAVIDRTSDNSSLWTLPAVDPSAHSCAAKAADLVAEFTRESRILSLQFTRRKR